MKLRINRQNDVYALEKYTIKWVTVWWWCQKNIKKPIDDGSTIDATTTKNTIGDGLLITTVASTTVGMFYALRAAGVGQHNALLTSTSLAWFMSLPVWKM